MSLFAKFLIVFGAIFLLAIIVMVVRMASAFDGRRLKCTSCNHCKKKQVRAAKGGKAAYISTYCYLLQRELPPDSRCVVKDKKKAMYENPGINA